MTNVPDWKGFGKAIMEDWASHGDIEASEKFDLARKFNILREIPGGFNPDHHDDEFGCAEPGDPWFEMNDTPAAVAALEPERDGVAEDIRAMIKDAQDAITDNMKDVMPSRDVENLYLGRRIGLEMALARLSRAED